MTFSHADWTARMLARHEEEVAAGKHDAECEYGPRMIPPTFPRKDGPAEVQTFLHMCHCQKRARIAKGETAPPGVLIVRAPDCPRCGDEVDHDGDVWVCSTCHVKWDPDKYDDEGEFTDDYGDLGRRLTPDETPIHLPTT